jgi:Tol biopolymer transport system component
MIAWEQNDLDAYAIQNGARTLASCGSVHRYPVCELGAPSFSPDGSEVVAARRPVRIDSMGDEVVGGGHLTTVGVDGSGERDLPLQTRDDENPAFLPDGRQLVFDGREASRGRELYTVGIDGTGLQALTTGAGSDPAPCSNGRIAFLKAGNVYLLSADHRTQRQVTFTKGAQAPSCSPDSRLIAFVRAGKLFTVGADGKHLRRVASDACNCGSGSVTFSPDGRQIGYLHPVPQSDVSGDGPLTYLTIRFVSPSGRRQGRDVPIVCSLQQLASAFCSGNGSAGIGWGRALAPRLLISRVPGSPFSTATGSDVRSVSFSPGGDLLAAIAANGSATLFAVDSHHGVVTRVERFARSLSRRVEVLSAAFSPDDRLLAVASAVRPGGIVEFLVDRRRRRLRRVARMSYRSAGRPSVLAFSPGGSQLAVGTEAGRVVLFSVSRSSGRLTSARAVDAGGRAITAVAFNRTGTRLAVASDKTVAMWSIGPSGQAVALPNPGLPPGALSGDSLSSLAWTPDGRLQAITRNGTALRMGSSSFATLRGAPLVPSGFGRSVLGTDGVLALRPSRIVGLSVGSVDAAKLTTPDGPLSPGGVAEAATATTSRDGRLMVSGNNLGGVSVFQLGNTQVSDRHCTVPDLVDATLRGARRRLAAAGCALGSVAHRVAQRDFVRGQSPAAGSLEPQRTRVSVSLSVRPARAPRRPAPVTILPLEDTFLVACPSVRQCTAVGVDGYAVTFNPRRPRQHQRHRQLRSASLNSDPEGLVCPSTTQCTVFTYRSKEITFNPVSLGHQTVAHIGRDVDSIACPSTRQCSVLSDSATLLSFDPQDPGGVISHALPGLQAAYGLVCASRTQCTAVDGMGLEETSDPRTGRSLPAARIYPAPNDSSNPVGLRLACPAGTECVATDGTSAITFDPLAPQDVTMKAIGQTFNTSVRDEGSLVCPSIRQCAVAGGTNPVDQDQTKEHPGAITFDPLEPLIASTMPLPQNLRHELDQGLACPSVSQCTAVGSGRELTFDPASPDAG